MKTYKSPFFIVLLFLCSTLNAQNNLDSLKTKSYDELFDLYKKESSYKEKETIATYFINKATAENNYEKKIAGYWYMAYLNSNNEKGLIAADSVIQLTLKGNNSFKITSSIKLKANFYFQNGNFTKALDYYLKAREFAENIHQYYEIQFYLGLIKTRIGKHRDALNIFKDILSFREKINEERKHNKDKRSRFPKNSILSAKYAIANSYKDLGLLDSASYINKVGLRESKKPKIFSTYYYFLLNQGTVDYLNKSYISAIDSLKKAKKHFKQVEDHSNYTETCYYIGESYLKINDKVKAILYFKKIDSVFNTTPGLLPIVRNSYEHLITHYKNKKDLKKQLKYLLQLKKMDSILVSQGTYASTKLLKEYDLPLIIGETKKINALLEKRRQFLNNVIGAITVVLIGVLSLLVFQYRRRKLYKARFNEVVNTETLPATNELKKIIEELTISKEIVSEILTALDQFERNKKYLNSDITLQSLAKEFNTNANYLSKVINHYKNGSYSKYVTGLRIQFAIDELKTNNTFRKYTIKAIAKEVGFNNPESFSKAFYAKTGIKPSYFIKELEKIK